MRARLFSITALLALAAPAGLAQTSVEHAVKAAYLAKFAPFIDWPEKAFDGPTAPLTICVLGPDPLGADLDKAASDQKDGDHPLVVRRLAAPEPDARSRRCLHMTNAAAANDITAAQNSSC